MKKLIRRAQNTVFGREHNFEAIKSYEDYKNAVPVTSYDYFHHLIERAKKGEPDTLWPGKINRFAISSGTTGKGKHIPVTDERLISDGRFMRRVALNSFRNPRRVLTPVGYQLSLPGTIREETIEGNTLEMGEISGFLGAITPWYLRFFQLIPNDKLVRMNWKEKFELVRKEGLKSDIRVINASPSWILILFQKVLQETGKTTIADVWPNLQAIFCGGVALSNYLEALEEMTEGLNIDYYENYGTSEGYIAFNSRGYGNELDLVINNNVFFEWMPADENGKVDFDNDTPVPTWEVEKGRQYGVIITSDSGLWRYRITDLVEFSSLNPLQVKVVGRTSDMLDYHGEALTYQEAYDAIDDVCRQMNVEFTTFTMTSLFEESHSRPYHFYFINWRERPNNTEEFSRRLDEKLRQINRHYQIRRSSGVLALPKVYPISNDQIQRWITSNPEITQTKMPEIIHNTDDVERLLEVLGISKKV